jgi:hypothetical protein
MRPTEDAGVREAELGKISGQAVFRRLGSKRFHAICGLAARRMRRGKACIRNWERMNTMVRFECISLTRISSCFRIKKVKASVQ